MLGYAPEEGHAGGPPVVVPPADGDLAGEQHAAGGPPATCSWRSPLAEPAGTLQAKSLEPPGPGAPRLPAAERRASSEAAAPREVLQGLLGLGGGGRTRLLPAPLAVRASVFCNTQSYAGVRRVRGGNPPQKSVWPNAGTVGGQEGEKRGPGSPKKRAAKSRGLWPTVWVMQKQVLGKQRGHGCDPHSEVKGILRTSLLV